MDTIEKQRRSRARPTASKKRIEVRTSDLIGIFEPLSRYAALQTGQIMAIDDRHFDVVGHRLGNLWHDKANTGKEWVRRLKDTLNLSLDLQQQEIYELGRDGFNALIGAGLVPDEPWVLKSRIGHRETDTSRLPYLRHDHIATHITLGIEIGAKKSEIPFTSHIPIILSAPETTRSRPKPLRIPLTFNGVSTHIEPDAFFAVGDYFYALEVDTGTESQTVIKRKAAYYREIAESCLIDDYLGIDGQKLRVLFATPSALRAKNILKAIDGPGRKHFTVAAFPEFDSFLKAPPPDERFFNAVWQRNGNNPWVIGRE